MFVGQFDESMQKICFGMHEVDDLDIFKAELDKFNQILLKGYSGDDPKHRKQADDIFQRLENYYGCQQGLLKERAISILEMLGLDKDLVAEPPEDPNDLGVYSVEKSSQFLMIEKSTKGLDEKIKGEEQILTQPREEVLPGTLKANSKCKYKILAKSYLTRRKVALNKVEADFKPLEIDQVENQGLGKHEMISKVVCELQETLHAKQTSEAGEDFTQKRIKGKSQILGEIDEIGCEIVRAYEFDLTDEIN